MITYILFIVGFFLLIKGADLLIEGGSSLAKKLNISDLLIGLTVVAFGTSFPELFVNILGSIKGNAQIAIGNILGSNIFNIFIVLGISAMISPLFATTPTARREIPMNFLVIAVLAIFANEGLIINGNTTSYLSRLDGVFFIVFFLVVFHYLFKVSKKRQVKHEHSRIKEHRASRAIILIIIGLSGLLLGAEWIVEGAVAIAKKLGLSEFLISSTIIAGGTSLPELAASVEAVRKGKGGMAVGNVIGSNIFNIFFILGISAIIRPLPFSGTVNIDVGVAFIASLLLCITMLLGRHKHLLGRWQGAGFIFLYIAYIAFLVMRG